MVTIRIQKSDTVIENFSIQFAKKDPKNALMYLGWDTALVAVPVSF